MNANRTKRKRSARSSSAPPAKRVYVPAAVQARKKAILNRGYVPPQALGRWFNATQRFPLPPTAIRKFKYAGQFNVNPAVGVTAGYVFRANSLYDPDVTGVGHQPYGFDQMMEHYNHYEVLEACIRVRGFPTIDSYGFTLGIKLDDNGSAGAGTIEACMEQPGWNWTDGNGDGAGRSIMVSQTFDAKKFFGDKYGDRDTWGTVATNPLDMAFFIVMLCPITSLQDLPQMPFLAEIEYVVKLHEPKEVVQS